MVIEKEMTTMKLSDIEGIGASYEKKLDKAGIRGTNALLERAGSAKGRKQLAAETGISDALLLEWVNHADLFRITGIGAEYADLLEEAGVDTVVELAKRVPEKLYAKMAEVNQAKNLVNKLPGQTQVADWIGQAKKLPKAVTY
jgi:predicted flap endonuclease-1-like 5' DNA nuclease